MVVSQTPFRISFFGGSSDYPSWYKLHGGAVLSTTIDKYCYISCRYLPPFFNYNHRVVYSRIELVDFFEEIKHPAIREILTYLGIDHGIEVVHNADLPARSGIGSSSSFVVGLLNAAYALTSKMISKQELANLAIYVEQELLKEHVGCQDQISTAVGGFNKITFKVDGSYDVQPIIIEKERLKNLEENLLLFYTGISRTASDIAKSVVQGLAKDPDKVKKMVQFVDDGIDLLKGTSSLNTFGYMLDEMWKIKSGLSSQVSSTDIEEIYDVGKRAGAIGGKLLGAGGGGFMLFYVPLDKQESVRTALKNFTEVPFKFESHGSRIIVYNP